MSGETVTIGVLFLALAAGAIVLVRSWFQSRGARARDVPPLLVIPHSPTRVNPSVGGELPPALPHALPPLGPTMSRSARMATRPMAGEAIIADVDSVPAIGANSETVRFRRPGEDPVQILPGRLEVLAGEPKHREIRFIRAPGEAAELILGRDPGHSPQAIMLHSDTVSRRHARFAFADGHWSVTNLSRTNPVVVNDERMADNSIERPLADGDRLELGEVVLRFRSR
jgi:FHA domain